MSQSTDTAFDLPQAPPAEPSLLGRFWRGFASGAVNGAIMMGIYALVMVGVAVAPAAGSIAAMGTLALGALEHVWGTALIGIATTSLFGGVMAVKHALEETPEQHLSIQRERDMAAATVLVPTLAQGMQPMIALDAAEGAEAASDAPGRWTDHARRTSGARPSIAEIIANREMSASTRAQSILAAREAAAADTTALGA